MKYDGQYKNDHPDGSSQDQEDAQDTQIASRQPDEDFGGAGAQPPVSQESANTTVVAASTGNMVKVTVATPVFSISENSLPQLRTDEILTALAEAVSHTQAETWREIGEVILEPRFELVSQGYACRILPRTEG